MDYLPWTIAAPYGDPLDEKEGFRLLQEGRVRTVILAGGSGSRLDSPHPKGLYPIAPITQKSLFQLFSEKAIAAGKMVGKKLPLAIMTSNENDKETRDFFSKNRFFGLDKVDFFTQEDLPYIDDEGKEMIAPSGEKIVGPAGNGMVFRALAQSSLLDQWEKEGVSIIHFILVDNPLADPFDRFFLGHMNREGAEASLKVCRRKDPAKNVGVIVSLDNKPYVVEYSEIGQGEKEARNHQGELIHPFFNISLMAFTLDFCKRIARESLPLHKAYKEIPKWQKKGWKSELFLFDALPFSRKTTLIEVPEEVTFAPLKGKEGEGSPEEVRGKLTINAHVQFRALFGRELPSSILEIAQDFYYPTDSLLKKWKGKSLPDQTPYLEP